MFIPPVMPGQVQIRVEYCTSTDHTDTHGPVMPGQVQIRVEYCTSTDHTDTHGRHLSPHATQIMCDQSFPFALSLAMREILR